MKALDIELQKHITLMGKVQYGMEREGWIYVEEFKEAMRFFIEHCDFLEAHPQQEKP